MSTYGNNGNQTYAQDRDSFFSESEIEHFMELLNDPHHQHIHNQLIKLPADFLYISAMELIDKVEEGLVSESEMEQTEIAIAHFLAAIEDYQRVKELTKDAKSKDQSDRGMEL